MTNQRQAPQPKSQSPEGAALTNSLAVQRTLGTAVAVLGAVLTLYLFSASFTAGFAGHFEVQDRYTWLGIASSGITIGATIFAILKHLALKEERATQRISPDQADSHSKLYRNIAIALVIGAILAYIIFGIIGNVSYFSNK